MCYLPYVKLPVGRCITELVYDFELVFFSTARKPAFLLVIFIMHRISDRNYSIHSKICFSIKLTLSPVCNVVGNFFAKYLTISLRWVRIAMCKLHLHNSFLLTAINAASFPHCLNSSIICILSPRRTAACSCSRFSCINQFLYIEVQIRHTRTC